MTKKFLSMLLAIAMVVSMFAGLATTASAASYTWTRVTSTGTLKAGGQFIIGYEAEEASSALYTDGVAAWAQSSVDAVCELGIMGTSGGRIGAGDELTRSEAAQMFYGIMNLIYE